MKIILLLLLFINSFLIAQQENESGKKSLIGINSKLSSKMLDANQDLRKINILLEEMQQGELDNQNITIGISLLSIFDYQKSNTDSKFAYLMRHPTSKNQIGKEVSEFVIHSFQLSFIGAVNNWLTSYAEILYNPEQSFGGGTITDLSRNQLQLRKGFMLIGNLKEFPVYGAIGKMDAPFGQTGSVSPFTNSTMWHAFGGLGYGAQIGIKKWNIHAAFMAVQGGSQFRAMHTAVGDSTSVPSKVNNFVVDVNYNFSLFENANIFIGASYLYGSNYCQDFPITHFADCKINNPAVAYYGKFTFDERFVLKGGFAVTTKVWPGTHNPTPPLDIFEASKVSSVDVGAKYNLNTEGCILYVISAEFSNFVAGPKGAPWERQNQFVLGFSGTLNNSSNLFIELFKTDGYAPLNFISGSNPFDPFPPGTTISINSANSFGVVLGGQIII